MAESFFGRWSKVIERMPIKIRRHTIERVGSIVHEYSAEYELRDPDYTPTEFERQMLEDFGNGLVAEIEERGFKIVPR